MEAGDGEGEIIDYTLSLIDPIDDAPPPQDAIQDAMVGEAIVDPDAMVGEASVGPDAIVDDAKFYQNLKKPPKHDSVKNEAKKLRFKNWISSKTELTQDHQKYGINTRLSAVNRKKAEGLKSKTQSAEQFRINGARPKNDQATPDTHLRSDRTFDPNKPESGAKRYRREINRQYKKSDSSSSDSASDSSSSASDSDDFSVQDESDRISEDGSSDNSEDEAT